MMRIRTPLIVLSEHGEVSVVLALLSAFMDFII